MSSIVTKTIVNYERWKGHDTRGGSKARPQNWLLPAGVLTCWEVKTESGYKESKLPGP
jgi:hypothetical protein